ncbi:MAG: glycosyl hydrolase 43 family protein [Firmicutes bacterium]|nr:glycosyl hydrolase 43 family protein [Bacillota bacterium]
MVWADVPDPSVIRVGEMYYMTSTTMHLSPGVPIMKSHDLVNWEIVNYVYDTLGESDAQCLVDGGNEYGKGSWASSLRLHDGVYYVVFSSQTENRTFVFQTRDIERGPWQTYTLPFLHDMSLLFDDGQVYLVHGSGDIRILELTSDATAVKPGGLNQVIIPNSSQIAGPDILLPAEGAHIHKVDGMYYLLLITWPRGGMRTQLCYRAEAITGPWEGRVVLQDAGIAQGGLVDTPDGNWYALLFGDRGAVGRIPYLVSVRWEDKWPILERKAGMPLAKGSLRLVASDEFEEPTLGLVWQWNHNPDLENWSLTERPGYLRLRTGQISQDITEARNTLTQRTFGPRCSGTIALDVSNMKNGDYAGLALFQKEYGFIGVKQCGLERSIVMVDGRTRPCLEVETIPTSETRLYFKIACDFREQRDRAHFYYSLDGQHWVSLGPPFSMSYTIPHFMGYRFALFHFATETCGGFVDFDYFHLVEA